MHKVITQVTERIRKRSAQGRAHYLQKVARAKREGPSRSQLSCTNLAHDVASATDSEKLILKQPSQYANIAIISAYNDLLSAHQPYNSYPEIIKKTVAGEGHIAQFAAGVPAMCDGITQGQPGMELSLFSRDVIAMSAAIALSHNVFDGALYLGICDKIVPGLMIAALEFGHLPAIFIPAGPMPSGLPNKEKARIRQQFEEGLIDSQTLLDAEVKSYHSPGTCTFYGTANSNQMLMEFLGVHLPGASFINPGTELRDALTKAASQRICQITALGNDYTALGEMIDERSIVNAIVGLVATGGSTNHTIHLVAIAKTAGITIDWNDLAEISAAVPLLARVYPNGEADINQFQRAGGVPLVIAELLSLGLLHDDVMTVVGRGMRAYSRMPELVSGKLTWETVTESGDLAVISRADKPFSNRGGIEIVQGNIGRAVVKVSAVPEDRYRIKAPAMVFDSQEAVKEAFEKGGLNKDFVAVVKNQGPRANGMPELHKLMPALGVLQDRGFHVALVTDGRLSGASGKVLSAIHVTPEGQCGGAISLIKEGDMIEIDSLAGKLQVHANLSERSRSSEDLSVSNAESVGRGLFLGMRERVNSAEEGATIF